MLNHIEKMDISNVRKQKEHIRFLQQEGLFPKSFDFPLLLQLELTRRCNVYCKHCYNNSGVNNQIKDLMTPMKWKEFCRYVVSKGGIFECVISGGEPLLLGEDLFEIMNILHDDGTNFLLITNGYLLTQSIVNRLENYRYKWIQVSIDGATADFHDEFRQRKGSWERAVHGAYMIANAGLPLTIAHSVSPGNLEDVDKMCELAYSVGAGNIIIGEISLSGRTYDNQQLLLNDEQREFLLERIGYNSKRYSGKMKVTRSMSREVQNEYHSNIPCGGLIIRPDGNVRLDCMMPFVLGNIIDEDLESIWNRIGKNCWDNDRIKKFMDSKEYDVRNYVDSDILLY